VLLGGTRRVAASPYSVYVQEAYHLSVPAIHGAPQPSAANTDAEEEAGEEDGEGLEDGGAQEAAGRGRGPAGPRGKRRAYATVLTNDAFCTGALVRHPDAGAPRGKGGRSPRGP
jgi:hypothetical protein